MLMRNGKRNSSSLGDIEKQLQLMHKYVTFGEDSLIKKRLSYTGFFRLRLYARFLLSKSSILRKKPSQEMLFSLYDFDEQMRILLFVYCKKAEIQLKTNISGACTEYEGSPFFYLSESSYTPSKSNNDKLTKHRNIKMFDGFLRELSILESKIRTDTSKYPEIRDMRPVGKSKKDRLPAGVAFSYLDMGDLCRIYSYLRGDLRKQVLRYSYTRKNYGKETTKQFDTWLDAVRTLRNSCAHHNMLAGKHSCVILTEFGEGTLLVSDTDLFSRLYALKKILPEEMSFRLSADIDSLISKTPLDIYRLGLLPVDWKTRFEKIRPL